MPIGPPPVKFYVIISRIECNPMILTIFWQWEYRSVGLYILMSQTRPSQANNLVCQFDSMTVLPVYSSSYRNYSDTSNALQVHTTCGIKSFREAACPLMCKPVSSQYSKVNSSLVLITSAGKSFYIYNYIYSKDCILMRPDYTIHTIILVKDCILLWPDYTIFTITVVKNL